MSPSDTSSKVSPIPPRDAGLPTKVYTGECHCGKFAFEFRHPVLEDGFEVVSCNCSICTQRGYLVVYITDPQNDFKLTRGERSDLTRYKFNTNVVSHMFCPVCGCGILAEGGQVIGVNVRAITGLNLDSLTLKKIDGRST